MCGVFVSRVGLKGGMHNTPERRWVVVIVRGAIRCARHFLATFGARNERLGGVGLVLDDWCRVEV